MAIQYVGGTSGSGVSVGSYDINLSGTLTGGIGMSPQAGDIIIVSTGFGTTSAVAPDCSGDVSGTYSNASGHLFQQATGAYINFALFYQVQGVTPDSSLTVTRVLGSNGGATAVHVWRGVDLTNPLDVSTTTATVAGGKPNAPPITPVTVGAVVIASGSGNQLSSSGAPYVTPSGMADGVSAFGNGVSTGRDVGSFLSSYSWASGAYDPAAVTGGAGANNVWAAATIALRPLMATGTTIDATPGNESATGLPANVSLATSVNCSIGAAAAIGRHASVETVTAINAGVGDAALGGLPASIQSAITITCGVGSLAADGLAAAVSIATSVDCAAGSLVAGGLPALVTSDTIISCSTGAVSAAGLPASLESGTTVTAGVGVLSMDGLAASIQISVVVSCGVGGLASTGLSAAVYSETVVNCSAGTLAATGLTASVTLTVADVRPNPARTLAVPARLRYLAAQDRALKITIGARRHALVAQQRILKIPVPARVRHIIWSKDMIHQADPKRPDESPVFSLDIRKELALTGDTITQVSTAIEVERGTDPGVAAMLVGAPGFTGTTISQRVGGGLSGNSYNIKFTVTTSQQELVYVMNVPVADYGAFAA